MPPDIHQYLDTTGHEKGQRLKSQKPKAKGYRPKATSSTLLIILKICINPKLNLIMTNKLHLILTLILLCSFRLNPFKSEQLKYPRVRQAYKDKEASMLALINKKNIQSKNLNICLRAFKKEMQIELWGKNTTDSVFKLIKVYTVCRTSGKPGPKRKQGDLQIPEGFYHINRFNPYSNFYLSLGINYPNASDKIMGDKNNPGGDIFIHGACVTIGCLPITDDAIKELYIFCVEARNNGQLKIPVTIFPFKMTDTGFNNTTPKYSSNPDIMELWKDLKKDYDIFNTTHQLPKIEFLSSGRHHVTL